MTNLEYIFRRGGCIDFSKNRIIINLKDKEIDKIHQYDFDFDSAWLLQEHKEPIRLTQAEKCILESIDKTFHYITRDQDGVLNVFEPKPFKSSGEWILISGRICTFCLFDKMFNFIKSEDKEPYLIEDIVNNCEVIE